jgi:DNA repair photolyase
MSTLALPGRGTSQTPPNRYETLHVELDAEARPENARALAESGTSWQDPDFPPPRLRTHFLRDHSRTILTENNSPDIGFDWSLNPYRGCEHGCVYCYARPTHEQIGFNAGSDFESRILVKEDAPAQLRRELAAKKWKGEVIALSGATDCYQPVERQLRLTRSCLEVLVEARNPVLVITKSSLVARDVDLLATLARRRAAQVRISITTLDPDLARRLEPRASSPARRLEAVRRLADAGIPTGVIAAPIIPGLNDSEMPAILGAAAEAGAQSASWTLLRLPEPVDELFLDWLERHRPLARRKIENLIRGTRDGKLSQGGFGERMRGQGEYAKQLEALFRASARRYGLDAPLPLLDTRSFRRPSRHRSQLTLAIG